MIVIRGDAVFLHNGKYSSQLLKMQMLVVNF
jgi:hypothetical protein